MRNKQLTIGALLSYASIFFNIVAGLLYTPWLVRTVGSDQYALYSLALSIINLFLLDFGIGSAVQKYLSGYYAVGDIESANKFISVVYKVFAVIAGIIAAALTIFYFFLGAVYVKLTPEELSEFKVLYAVVGLYSVVSFPCTTYNGVLMANEKFISLKACNLGQKVFNVALIVVMLLTNHGVFSLVLVNALSNFVFYAIKYILIRKTTPTRAKLRYWNKDMAKRLLSFSAWITVIYIAQRFIFNIAPTMLTAMVGSAAVTVFSLSASLEGYVFTFADAINGMFMPTISRIYANDENSTERITELMVKVGRYHIYTIGLIYIGLVVIGRRFVGLWMGAGFEDIYICALLMIFPSLIDVPQQIGRSSLLVRDKAKGQGIAYIIMAVLNIVLSLLLIPRLGVIGASIAICVSYLVRTFVLNMMYRKYLELRLGYYFRRTYLRWSLTAALTMAVGFIVDRFLPLGGWIGLLVCIVVIAAVYLLLLLVITLDRPQKESVRRFLRKFKRS